MKSDWCDDDYFWQAAAPVIFSRQRREEAAIEVAQVAGLLGLPAGAPVLDLCCGIGRHSTELARRGHPVTAVDRTRAYLDQARVDARAAGVEIELVEADMRDFCRPEAYAGIVNLFTSFGYFRDPADDQRVAQNMARSLQPRGKLVLDTMSKEILARDFIPRSWVDHEGLLLLEERTIDEHWARINTRWVLVPPNGDRIELRLSLRVYAASELVNLLITQGFSQVQTYGGLDGSPYDEKAQRLVVVATR